MAELIIVTYDGEVLKPKTPLNLDTNKEYQIQVVINEEKSEKNQQNAWDILEDLVGTYNAPQDWSSEHNYYLYGTPKSNEN